MSEHFKILYMTYFKKVYLTCFMILGSHALAEEVTQETFMTAYEKIHTLKDTAKFSTWLLAIARNKATNLYKRNKKVVPINNEDLLNYLEQQTDNKEDIADILVKKELIENVKKNITIMPPELRELIILKYYLQLKDQEISEITNKPLNTVKSSLHRARKVLAKSLSKEYVLSKERVIKLSPQDNLDLIIAKAIKEIEHEALKGMPSPEETWKDFVTRIREQELNKGNKFHRYINIKGALIACVALLLLIAFQNKNVVAFKNELVRWIGKDNNHQTIIMEHENPEIEKGSYTNLTLAEAKEKVLFHIVEPSFLPVDINQEPDVEVEMYEYPWSLVKITYQGNNKKIITIKQENTPGHGQRNTFIPENGDLKEVTINNWDIILIEQDEALNARWVDNGIRYIITTYKISKSELIKLIESLE